jgi:NMD protein affecting ribosome stability and mRNA decay
MTASGGQPAESRNPEVWKPRRDNIVAETGHDAYRERGHIADPAVCPECRAVYLKGRWHWAPAPRGAAEHTCPACRRIADAYPAGFLSIGGPYFAAHRTELLNLVRNQETAEKDEHPLNRIMTLEEGSDGLEITTTDVHLPRRIGEALHDAHAGTIEVEYAEDDTVARVRWRR